MFTDQFKHEINGYLKSDIWRMLNAAIPKQMIKIIEETIKSVK